MTLTEPHHTSTEPYNVTWRDSLKIVLLFIAKFLGLFAVARRLTRNKLRILGYHGIWYSPGHFGNRIFMKPETFRRRMAWLARSGYPVLPFGEAVERLYRNELPDCAVSITIDDGWYGTYRDMAPALKEFGLPATVYVCTGEVDTQLPVFDVAMQNILRTSPKDEVVLDSDVLGEPFRMPMATQDEREVAAKAILEKMSNWEPDEVHETCRTIAETTGGAYDALVESRQLQNMTYEEIGELAEQGIDIQLHTHNHRVDPEEPESVAPELEINRDKLAQSVSAPLEHFCYPSGVYSLEMAPYMEKLGIRSATTVEAGLVDDRTHPYLLSRILDGEYVSQIEIEAELAGLLELKRMLVARLKGEADQPAEPYGLPEGVQAAAESTGTKPAASTAPRSESSLAGTDA